MDPRFLEDLAERIGNRFPSLGLHHMRSAPPAAIPLRRGRPGRRGRGALIPRRETPDSGDTPGPKQAFRLTVTNQPDDGL